MEKSNFKSESILLLVVATLTLILLGLLKGGFSEFWTSPFRVQLFDTYFELGTWQLFAFMFLNGAFWIYLVRQLVNGFKKPLGNGILLVVTGLLIFATTLVTLMVGEAAQGWTVYPPLSAMPMEQLPKTSTNSWMKMWMLGFELFQIVIFGVAGVMVGRGSGNPKQ